MTIRRCLLAYRPILERIDRVRADVDGVGAADRLNGLADADRHVQIGPERGQGSSAMVRGNQRQHDHRVPRPQERPKFTGGPGGGQVQVPRPQGEDVSAFGAEGVRQFDTDQPARPEDDDALRQTSRWYEEVPHTRPQRRLSQPDGK